MTETSGARVRPEPPITPETETWWNATRERRLTVQTCGTCGNVQMYPRAICIRCGSTDLKLAETSGLGQIYSFTIVERSPDPQNFPPPYVVALVRLDEGPTLLTNIVGQRALSATCDAKVVLTWEALPDGRHLPLFRLKD